MKSVFKNWKTTVAGIIVGGVAAAVALHWITQTTGTEILSVAGALGLMAAKDGNVTGGTTPQ